MKKKVLLLIILLIPFIVHAKEYCKVVEGNGKDTGSEISCGTEHFYIVDSSEDEIRALAKYNLYVGEIIEKIKIDREIEDPTAEYYYCVDLARRNNATSYRDGFYNVHGYCFLATNIDNIDVSWATNDSSYTDETCLNHMNELNNNDNEYTYFYHSLVSGTCYYKKILKNIKQNENAVSVHWDENNNYLFPQVGDIYINGFRNTFMQAVNIYYSDFYLDNMNTGEKYDNYFYDLVLGNGPISVRLNNYKKTLEELGFTINNVNLLSLGDINNINKSINKTEESFPYEEWYNHSRNIVPPHYEFGSIKEYLPNKGSFLYNTSYWIRTGFDLTTNSNPMGLNSVIIINSNGGVCSSELTVNSNIINTCQFIVSTTSKLGAGLRPLITIPNELEYLIRTKTNGNGSIETVTNSLGDKGIRFKVNANKGYELDKIIITTDSGEKVEFTKGDVIINNEDGTVSLIDNKFTMPFENVTVEAAFKPMNKKNNQIISKETIINNPIINKIVNPDTGDKIVMVIFLLISSLLIIKYLYDNKKKILLLVILFIPFVINAKSNYLYNVMADEAEYNDLTEEYTGEHHDSFIEEPSKKIYKWKSGYNNTETANTITEKNNVLFADKCWQIFRTTDTGGTKMIYNGDAENGKCLTNRPNHAGFAKSTSISLGANYWYGTDYTFDSQNNKFKIAGDKIQKIWNNENAASLIGKYTCRSTNVDSTCSTLYLTESLAPYSNGNVIPINSNISYPYIGSMNFNKSSLSLAYAGYMYGDVYLNDFRQIDHSIYFSTRVVNVSEFYLRSNVYVADDVTWNSTLQRYELVDPYNVSTVSDLSSLVGKYAIDTNKTYGTTVYYIVKVNNTIASSKALNNGENINDIGNINLGTSYSVNNDGTYTIENTTSMNEIEWLQTSEGHQKEYICPDGGLTCSDLRFITTLDNSGYYYINVGDKITLAKGRNGVELTDAITILVKDYYDNFPSGIYNDYKYTCETNNNICTEENLRYIVSKSSSGIGYADNKYWGTGVTWDGTNYTLKNPIGVEAYDKMSNISTHHYTCIEKGAKTCSTVAYVFAITNNKHYMQYVTLSNGTTSITELFNNMLTKNTNNSIIKTAIDSWYKRNILAYDDMIEDTIYCNSRDVFSHKMAGWNETNGSVTNSLEFYEYTGGGRNLSCTKITDKFSINNNQAKLDYKIGLLSYMEANLVNNKYIRTPGNYWLGTPSYYNDSSTSLGGNAGVKLRVILSDGGTFSSNMSGSDVNYSADQTSGVRPVISIKNNIVAYGGDGSKNNPYLLRKPISNDITIDNNNEKGIVNIEKVSDIQELSKVTFSVESKEGYTLSEIEITDNNGEAVSYDATANDNEYELIMPDSDITIKTVYEKVKNSINVQIVDETENINININDLTQVEYKEEVTFTITPIKGYKVNSIKVLDSNGKKINITSNNNSYSFVMPAFPVSIIPTYERVSNKVSIDNNPNTKEFMIKVKDASLVVYEDTVKFTIIPKEDYKLEEINIIDKEKNSIDYKKTNKENEYEFIMPDTDVVITPIYKYILRFIEGMNQNYNIYKDSVIKFRLNIKCLDFINNGVIYIDNELVDKKNYILSEGSTIITLNDKYSKSLKAGKHEIVVKLKDGSTTSTYFTISDSIILDSIVDKIVNPNTVDKIIIIIILLLISLGIYNYLKHKKMKVN